MFSTKTLAVAAATAALLAGGTAFAGTMVVRSTGPSAASYPVGKPLAADARIPLRAGDVVTVLDSNGTRVLRGPGTVAVAGSGAKTASGFSALIANTGARQARTGATRSAIGGGPARSPNVWYVDASKGGTQCVSNVASLTLWRPDSAADGSVSVTRVSDGKVVAVAYRVGQSTRAWPVAELPVEDGAQFRILAPGAKAPVTIQATMVAQPGDNLDGVAASLIQKGCHNQVEVLVEGTMQEPQGQLAAH